MSGAFSGGHGGDGGGGQAGHGGHGGGSFMDGGNHDHNHHHGGFDSFHEGHDHGHGGHGGGEGNESSGLNFGSLFGLNQQHQHSFIAHLLGLDQDSSAAHMHGVAGHTSGLSAQMPFWSAAIQSMTLASLFQGMRFSAAGWMLIMFLGFLSWLFMISWVRHHEPIANALIGTKIDNSYVAKFTALSDRDAPMSNGNASNPAVKPGPGAAPAGATPAAAVPPFGSLFLPSASTSGVLKGTPGGATAAVIAPGPSPPPVMDMQTHIAAQIPAHATIASRPGLFTSTAVPGANVPVYQAPAPRIKTIINR
jgi:hypothetical protein